MFFVLQDLGKCVIESLKKYYTILKQNSTRDGIISRKLVLESITGSDICDNKFLTQIAESVGARKALVLECSRQRARAENDQKLIPFLSRLERKRPEGEKVISPEWQLKAVALYESEIVSDVCKGYNNVLKV